MRIEDLEPGADVPETNVRTWIACVPGPFGQPPKVEHINIERVSWESRLAYYYVSRGPWRVGTWPGSDSDEWIEYIPENRVVEAGGDLFWRVYNAKTDTIDYVRLTNNASRT